MICLMNQGKSELQTYRCPPSGTTVYRLPEHALLQETAENDI